LKIGNLVNSKYFKNDEAKETLTGVWNPNAPLRQKTYTYKSGAIYTG